MTEQEFCEWLEEKVLLALEEEMDDNGDGAPDVTFRSFEECGLFTNNKGLVIKVNKERFQVTIVKDER